MRLFKDEKSIRIIKTGSFLVILYFLLSNIGHIFSITGKTIKILMPFIVGAAMAYILNVPMRKVESGLFRNRDKFKGSKWDKRRRIFALLITLFLTVLVIALVAYLIIPQLIETIAQLISQIPAGINNISKWASGMFAKYPGFLDKVEDLISDWQTIMQTVVSFIRNSLNSILEGGISAVTGIVSGVINFIIGFIFSIYILLQKEKLGDQAKKVMYALIDKKYADWWMQVGDRADKTITGFISGQFVEAIIIGLMFFVVMTIFRLPYTMLISLLIAVMALIPIVGATIGCAVGCLFILLVDPVKVILFLIIFIVIQQVEGNLIYPIVVGNSVGLPGILVLVSLTVGGNLFGIAGMIVFIPLVSVLYALLREFVYGRLREKGLLTKDFKLIGNHPQNKDETGNIAESEEAENHEPEEAEDPKSEETVNSEPAKADNSEPEKSVKRGGKAAEKRRGRRK